MLHNPTVSIILPAYNAEEHIEEAIQSIINQSFQDWELIVINDGSVDRTGSLVIGFDDPRITLIEQFNSGVSSSRNIGLLHAMGTFITFIDSDDTFPNNSLEARVGYLIENPDVHVVGGAVRIMNSRLDSIFAIKVPRYRGPFLPKLLALDDQIYSGICYMVRKDILYSQAFDFDVTHCEDLLFWIKVSLNSRIVYGSIGSCVYNYRVHPNSATQSETKWRSGYIEFVKRLSMIEGLSYWSTLSMRIKILFMLLKWHFKRKSLKDIGQIFQLLYL